MSRTFTFTSALSTVTVQSPIWMFSELSLFSTFHVQLFSVAFLDSSISPYHYPITRDIPHALFSYCTVFVSQDFSTSVLITLPSPDITSVITHIPLSLPPILVCGLMLGMVLWVRTCWLQYMVTWSSGFISTNLLRGHTGVRCLLFLLLLLLFARDEGEIFVAKNGVCKEMLLTLSF